MTSTIHDLGYRRYDGPRQGPAAAWSALYVQSLRAMFGIGRPLKAKGIPLLVLIVSTLPALAVVTAALGVGWVPCRFDTDNHRGLHHRRQLFLFVLYIAAQAPEVLSRDQQHRLLPLLFTRDVTRMAYATARFGAVFTAMFCVAIAPMLLLYIGQFGIATDPSTAVKEIGTRIFPILAQATLSAFAMSGIGTAIASSTPRRAYATAGIFGTFLLLAAIASGLDGLAGVSQRSAELLDPLRAMRTMALILFEETNRGMELTPPQPLGVYIAVTVAFGVVGLAVLVWRMRRIRA